MKKRLSIVALILCISMLSVAIGAYAAVKYSLVINGKTVKADIKVINGTPYIPLNALSNNLKGITVKHDAKKGTIQITEKDTVKQPAAVQSYPVDVTLTSGPMVMKISKVYLDPSYKQFEYATPIKAVVFDVKIENTSDDIVYWYPAANEIVTNSKEQLRGDSYINGDYKGKVVRTGKIAFKVTGELKDVTSLTYYVDSAISEDYKSLGEDISTVIILK